MMDVEKILRKIPDFQNIILDIILFESKYPVLFTCKNEKDIYLFICCLANTERIKWIGTQTSYDNLIELLENRITIRDAFLNVSENKIVIDYDGINIDYSLKKGSDIPEKFLPTEGEYMDAEEDEYAEEIEVFRKRNQNTEYVIKLRMSSLITYYYKGESIFRAYDDFFTDLNVTQYKMETIHHQKVVLV